MQGPDSRVFDISFCDENERFDFVTTFDAVHDQKHPQALIRLLRPALRPGGVYLMQDIRGSAKLEYNLDPKCLAVLCDLLRPLYAGLARPERRGLRQQTLSQKTPEKQNRAAPRAASARSAPTRLEKSKASGLLVSCVRRSRT